MYVRAHPLSFDDKGTALEFFLPNNELFHHLTRDESSLVVRLDSIDASSKVQANNIVQIDDRTATVSPQSTDVVLDATKVLSDIMEKIVSGLTVLAQIYLSRPFPYLIVGLECRVAVDRKSSLLKFL